MGLFGETNLSLEWSTRRRIMEDRIIMEASVFIDGTTYTVRSDMPSKDDVKTIKNKVRKLIINNLENNEKDSISSAK